MKKWAFLVSILSIFILSSLSAAENQKISVQEYYGFLQKSLDEKNWKDVLNYSSVVKTKYASSPFAKEASYYEGLAYFEMKDYFKANEKFSSYLEEAKNPKYFDETMAKKFLIAEKWRQGEKKPLFGLKLLPRLQSADDEALQLYEEIISSLPNDELAKQSLFAKGKILFSNYEYKDSIETFQKLIRHFPKSDLAIESFIEIAKVYLAQCSPKNQDLNLLGLAEVNVKHFEEAFPSEKQVEKAKAHLLGMKEIYAEGLYEIGRFFERTSKPEAALIYYSKILDNFPESSYSKLSQERVKALKK